MPENAGSRIPHLPPPAAREGAARRGWSKDRERSKGAAGRSWRRNRAVFEQRQDAKGRRAAAGAGCPRMAFRRPSGSGAHPVRRYRCRRHPHTVAGERLRYDRHYRTRRRRVGQTEARPACRRRADPSPSQRPVCGMRAWRKAERGGNGEWRPDRGIFRPGKQAGSRTCARIQVARTPHSVFRLAPDNCSYRAPIAHFGRSAGGGGAAPPSRPQILCSPAAQFNPMIHRRFSPPGACRPPRGLRPGRLPDPAQPPESALDNLAVENRILT